MLNDQKHTLWWFLKNLLLVPLKAATLLCRHYLKETEETKPCANDNEAASFQCSFEASVFLFSFNQKQGEERIDIQQLFINHVAFLFILDPNEQTTNFFMHATKFFPCVIK